MSEPQYFIQVQGKVRGPFAMSDLKKLRGSCGFKPADRVSEDRQTWVSVQQYPELCPPAIAAPVPVEGSLLPPDKPYSRRRQLAWMVAVPVVLVSGIGGGLYAWFDHEREKSGLAEQERERKRQEEIARLLAEKQKAEEARNRAEEARYQAELRRYNAEVREQQTQQSNQAGLQAATDTQNRAAESLDAQRAATEAQNRTAAAIERANRPVYEWVKEPRNCSTCGGSGMYSFLTLEKPKKCYACAGSGKILVNVQRRIR